MIISIRKDILDLITSKPGVRRGMEKQTELAKLCDYEYRSWVASNGEIRDESYDTVVFGDYCKYNDTFLVVESIGYNGNRR